MTIRPENLALRNVNVRLRMLKSYMYRIGPDWIVDDFDARNESRAKKERPGLLNWALPLDIHGEQDLKMV